MKYLKPFLAISASCLFLIGVVKTSLVEDKAALVVDKSPVAFLTKSEREKVINDAIKNKEKYEKVSKKPEVKDASGTPPHLVQNKSNENKSDSKKISFYDVFIENITQEINFEVVNSRTLEKRAVRMNGEALFSRVKSDFAYMLDSEAAKSAFKNYFLYYYEKNKKLSNRYRKARIDLLDFDNFARFSSLREAFLFYKSKEPNQLKGLR